MRHSVAIRCLAVALTLSAVTGCADTGPEGDQEGDDPGVNVSEEELGLPGRGFRRVPRWWWWWWRKHHRSDAGAVDGGTGEVDSGTGEVDSGTGEVDSGTGEVDSGTGEVDSGTGEVDSGTVEVDSGTVEVDSGTVEVDSGTVEVDSGTVEVDSGTVEVDSGTVEVDSGTVEVDSGTVEVDSGTVEVDSGTVEVDSGTVEVDSGVVVTARFGTETCDTCIEANCNPYFGFDPVLEDCVDAACEQTFACFQRNRCAADVSTVHECYCGDVEVGTCVQPGYVPVGPCAALVTNGLGVGSDPQVVLGAFFGGNTGTSDGIRLFNCAAELCIPECVTDQGIPAP